MLKQNQTLALLALLLLLGLSSCTSPLSPTPSPTPAKPPTLLGQEGEATYYELTLSDGTALQYAVVEPEGFTPDRTYPILLAMPPGAQTRELVDFGLETYWAAEAKKRGWVVLSPVAPGGTLFFQGSERVIPEFLAQTAARYRPEGGKYYLGGISNGGLSAFRLAVNDPQRYWSLVVLPGLPYSQADFDKLAALKKMPVVMFVGEQDSDWLTGMQRTEAELTRLGGQVTLEVVPNEGHVIHSLSGARLFDLLDSFRPETK